MLVGTPIEHLLLECGLARSGSEATRKVQQGAVRVNGEKFTTVRTPVDRADSFLLQVGRQIVRIVVVTPSDVFVSTIPSQSGDGWIIMQNKGQVDVVHHTRESAIARAREVAASVRSRVFVFENERLLEDGAS
jgi:ribosomal protein S4